MPDLWELSHLLNPLATSLQLEITASQLDGVPKQLEEAVRFEAARLLQAAGVLLHLPQEIIARAVVILARFWTGPEGGSLLDHDAKVSSATGMLLCMTAVREPISNQCRQDVAAAAVYLAAKPSGYSVTPRSILTSFEYLTSLKPGQLTAAEIQDDSVDVHWRLSESRYEAARNRLYDIEAHILRVTGFEIHVALPHALCINYLQTLDAFRSDLGSVLAHAVFGHLNSALLSPQLLYLTHQPSSIATAAIYLAARECGVKLPETEWWEVFDVDREELGFLVVALRSFEGFAASQKQKWSQRKVPVTVEELHAEMERSRMLEDDA